jgi:hypothetical protein
MPPAAAPDPYLVAWDRWRNRRRAKWVLFFAWPFAAKYVLEAMLGAHLLRQENLLYGYFAIGLAAFVWMGRLSLLDCPRCGGRMFIFGWWGDRRGDGCNECELTFGTPKYQAKGVDP